MENNSKVVWKPTRVHTREIDRAVAHNNMKKLKMQNVNDHGYIHGMSLSDKQGNITRTDSYFAENWRKYVGK